MENEKRILQFDLSAKQIKYQDILKKEFIELEIYAISDVNPNRNRSHFTLESMKKALPNVKNKPIVGFFENNDFTTHEGKADYDIETQTEFWNTEKGERILGWVRESDPVEIVEENGLHWLKFRCILCTTYCYKQVLRLLKDKRKKVSVEITVHESKDRDGIEDIYDFTLNGVTILGSKHGKAVLEGIQGAHLSVLENIDDERFEEQKKVLTFAYQQFDNVDAKNEDNIIVEGEENLNEEKSKKEVNQANMDEAKTFAASIEVDKSKEAMSDKPWGEVDKTELRRRVVEADNFKSIAGDIFLDLREGWEDGEVTKLKYPVMELKDNTAVYNRGGLASAKAYAEQHNDSEVLSKLKKIYEHLELDEDQDDKEAAYEMCKECKDFYSDDCGCDEADKDDHVEEESDKHCEVEEQKSEECHDANCDCHTEETENHNVEVVEVTPDVVVVTEPTETVDEGAETLNMEEALNMDLGIPQCGDNPEEVKEAAEEAMPKELAPDGEMNIVISNDEEITKVTVTDEEGNTVPGAKEKIEEHSDWIEKLEALQEKCCGYEKTIVEKDEEIAGYKAELEKCCDYEEMKQRLEAAEAKLEGYRCGELKAAAEELMSGENIKDEFYKDIMGKCECGKYSCEDEIRNDVAIAIFNSRQPKEKRFSTELPVVEIKKTSNEAKKQKSFSAAEGISNYLKK